MRLTKTRYLISRETIEKCIEALGNNWFSYDGEDEYNNEDIIEAHRRLQKEVESQDIGYTEV